MTIHEFGKDNKEVILLIHPSLVMWDLTQRFTESSGREEPFAAASISKVAARGLTGSSNIFTLRKAFSRPLSKQRKV